VTPLRIATCARLPEPDSDANVLDQALRAGGFAPQLVAWDDPSADWDAPIATVIRSTWNYVQDVDAFLRWLDRAAASGPVLNPPDIVRGNVRKRYLLELAARGVDVVPTQLFERHAALPATPFESRVVIKPEVGAGSFHARAFELGDPEAHAHLAMLTARGAALVQPYVASVDDYGERSIVCIAGELTHAIRKAPRFAGGVEQTTGPHPIDAAERALADAALAPVRDRVLYARVDMARDDAGRPMVMELELVEPSLFFTRSPYALERFVTALRSRLTATA
jgi:glutathione synthase/RimK-type ligase-like ATP-grasp enzyme